MSRRRIDPRRAKSHRVYETADVVRLFGVHKNTVGNWVKAGLQPVDDGRPMAFRGDDLRAFLTKRRDAKKRPCKPGELFCLPCRKPTRPAGGMVDYIPSSPTGGNLRGICPDCDRLIHRRASLQRLGAVASDLDVSIQQGQPSL